ncbi:MAG: hypothetical protein KDA32_11180 [Phycisphaerales bacterium]|nr:hypothetical protein [Phycisphaerales bacterium]
MVFGTLTFHNPLVIENDSLQWKKTLSDAYGGKTGKALSLALLRDGYDGVVTVDNGHASEILDLTSFDETVALYQSSVPSDSLFVSHNLTERNLEHAQRMGGIPVPSLAVTTLDAGFDNFGEISLLADPSLIDPKQNPYASTYNSDIYSPRYPTVNYKVNRGRLYKFWDRFGDTVQEMGTHISNGIDESEIKRNGLRPIYESVEMQYAWLKETGRAVKPVMQPRPSLADYGLTDADAAQWGNQYFVDYQQLMRDPEFKALVRERLRALNQKKYGENPEVVSQLNEMLDEGDSLENMAMRAGRRISAWWQWKKDAVNTYETRNKVRDKMGPKLKKEYDAWVQNEFSSLIDGDYVVTETSSGNLKKGPHTLDNVVSIMMRNLRGGEGFNYGVGNVRSKVAKKFSSIGAIQKDRSQIRSKKEFDAAKDEMQDRFVSLLESLKPYYRYEANAFGYLDAASENVGEYAASGRRGRLQDYRDVPAYIMEELDRFLDELRTMPTEYFEAKITRAVQVNEFAGAVVPKSTKKSTIDYLKRQGLQVRTYDKKVEGDRARVVGQFKKLLFQNFESTRRGSIQFGADRQFNINLLKKANLSTFLHESGHFYLEVLGDLAEADGASTQIMQDYASILKWFGVENRQGITVEHHEKFARGFEAYLMEGVAPSIELQNAFARFKAWMTQIYELLTELRVELNDEVRGVFDRIIATDQAIEAARQSQQYVALFTTAEDAGWSEQQFATYRETIQQARIDAEEDLGRKLLAVMTREQRKWWKAERAKLRGEVASEVHGMRVYKALSFLRFGKNPDGSAVEGMEPMKLSKSILMDDYEYPQEFLKRLPGAGRSTVYAVDGGVHPDVVAGMFGYRGADELIQDLVNARPMKELIEAETDARMRERYPDPLTDGSLTEQAIEAVHNDKQAQLMAAEMRALRKKAREVRPFVRAAEQQAARNRREARDANRAMLPDRDDLKLIKAAAARMVGAKQLRAIRPDAYRSAEAKAARKAFDAAARGDFEAAYQAKRQQILNHELYRAATEAQAQSEKIRSYFKKFSRRAVRERLGRADDGSLEKIEALLEGIDLGRISNRQIDRNAEVSKVLELVRAGELVAEPETIALLERATVTNWREMTYDAFVGLRDVVKQLETQAANLSEAVVLGEKIKIAKAARDVAESITQSNKAVQIQLGTKGPAENFTRRAKEALMSWLRPAEIARQLDGGKDFGPVLRTIIEPIRRAYAEKLIPAEQKIREDVANLYRKHFTNDELGKFKQRINLPEIGYSLTRGDLLSLALNWGNQGNRQAILDSQFEGRPLFSERGVQQALGRLSERDWQFVQDVWDYIDTYWADISALEKRRRGISPKKVEATPIQIRTSDDKNITVRGGYYPLKYDTALSQVQAADDIEAEFSKMMQGRHVTASTRAGATHERVGSGKRAVRLGLGVIDEHLHEIVRDLSLGDEARFVMRVLDNADVKSAMTKTGNQDAMQALRLWLQDTAVGEMAARGFVNKTSAYLRVGFTKAKLAWNVVTTLLQVTGLPQTMVVVGAPAVAHGVGRFASNPLRAHQLVMSQSAFMRSRYQTNSWNKDVSDTRAYLHSYFGGVPTRASTAINAISASYFWPIAKVQMVVDEITWLAGYWKGVQEKGLSGKDAGLYADSVVENAQTSGFFSDRSGIERGTTDALQQRQSQFVKLWTTLISYMLAKGNIAYAKGRSFMRNPTPWGAVTLATDLMLLFTVEAVLAAAIRGQLPDDEDDESLWWWLAKETMASAMSGVPFIREVQSARYGSGNTPLGGVATDLYKSMLQAEQGEIDAQLIKSFNNVGGTLFHYPSSQINRAVDAYWRESEGEDVAPYEYITGKRDKQ